jgi:hypothetical protein
MDTNDLEGPSTATVLATNDRLLQVGVTAGHLTAKMASSFVSSDDDADWLNRELKASPKFNSKKIPAGHPALLPFWAPDPHDEWDTSGILAPPPAVRHLGTAGASGSTDPVPPPAVAVPPFPWEAELHDVHRAYRRTTLSSFYELHRPETTTPTLAQCTKAADLAHQDYATFLQHGVRRGCLTQAMADGPFALTSADTTWLQTSVARTEDDDPQGYWQGP